MFCPTEVDASTSAAVAPRDFAYSMASVAASCNVLFVIDAQF
jgi:hypothetical protein